MVSTFTSNVGLEKPANGDYANTWSTPVNADWDIVDACIGGSTSLNATGASGTTVLTITQYRSRIVKITGTLTANVTYQVPSGVGGFWFVQNNTTGAFTVTVNSGGAGTSVVLSQGYTTPITSDGTNIAVGFTQPASTAAAGSNSQVQYNNSGSLGASSNFTFNSGTGIVTATGFAGNLTGNMTGTVTGSCTGSAGTVVGAPSGAFVGTTDTQTLTNKTITTVASATGGAGFNLPPGAAPTTPSNGDMWTTATSMFARLNSVSVDLGAGGIVASSLANPGYIKWANGFMVQWGTVVVGSNSTATVTFGHTYTTWALSFVGGSWTSSSGTADQVRRYGTTATTGFNVVNPDDAASSTAEWMAIGV